MEIDLNKIVEQLTGFVGEYGLKLVGAIVVWIIGSMIVKGLTKTIRKRLNKSDMDDTLKPFLGTLVGTLLKNL